MPALFFMAVAAEVLRIASEFPVLEGKTVFSTWNFLAAIDVHPPEAFATCPVPDELLFCGPWEAVEDPEKHVESAPVYRRAGSGTALSAFLAEPAAPAKGAAGDRGVFRFFRAAPAEERQGRCGALTGSFSPIDRSVARNPAWGPRFQVPLSRFPARDVFWEPGG